MSNIAKSTYSPSLAVVIVSYNTASITAKAVQTVLASTGLRLSVYIVDNHSSDRTLTTLRRRFHIAPDKGALVSLRSHAAEPLNNELFPNVQKDAARVSEVESAKSDEHQIYLISAEENLGFGRANNLAATWTEAEYILFLNSDTEVQPGTLQALVRQFQEVSERQSSSPSVLARWQRQLDNLGILAAQLHNPDGSVQRQGGALPSLTNIFRWISFLDDLPGVGAVLTSYQHQDSDMRSIARRTITKVGWVGGTALMISRRCLQEIGGFDPVIFMYAEDIDLCWRATQRHWDVAITSAANIIHLGSASSTKRNAILGEISGLIYMWEKHHSQSELRMLKLILRFVLRLRVIVFGILHRYGQQRIYHEALALV